MLSLRKLTAILLLLCMLFSTVSCNESAPTPPDEGESTGGETTAADTSETTAAETTAAETTGCSHTYTEEVLAERLALQDGRSRFTCTACGDNYEEVYEMTETIKILAIGNSFSVDAMEYLWNICRRGGVKTVVLGNLYIGGCTLETHWSNISSGAAAYTYYKNTGGTWTTTEGKSVQAALAEEQWDIITVQQASGESGRPASFSTLPKILNFVDTNKTNPDAKIMWHMTWAYQSDSTHKSFPVYNKNQTRMYDCIQNCISTKVLPEGLINGVIPAGTAIQNLRSSYIGDTVTRDGYHLNSAHGRYTAALTWFAYLTGGSVDAIEWVPTSYQGISADLSVIREAVKGALATPFAVTPSATPTLTDAALLARLGLDIQNYRLLDWTPRVRAFWNSQSGFSLSHAGNSTSSVLPYYIASKQFTKAELPVGAVIVVDAGYQYRPEGWRSQTDTSTSSTRPQNVVDRVVKVTDAWWGSYQYRAFNVAHVGAKTAVVEGDAAHFRIYVPVS